MACRWLVLLVCLACPGTVAGQSYGHYQTLSGTASVGDGDTVTIGDDRIRLWGIDTPESRQKCENRDGGCFPCGKIAKEHLQQLIADSGADVVYCMATGGVTYGRYVGICYAGDTNLNEQMVLAGWGLAYDRYTPAMAPAEKRARALKRGIWAGRFVPPEQWRRGDRLPCEGG